MNKKIFYTLLIGTALCMMSFKTSDCIQSEQKYNVEKINNDNYYDYYVEFGASTDWLRRFEVVPIIIEELEMNGFKTSPFVLYEFQDNSRIVLDVYNSTYDIGIVFNTGHFADVEKEHRKIKTYNQVIYRYGGSIGWVVKNEILPENILVLQETWYWYQFYGDNSTDGLLNKETAIKILRQDVREFLDQIKKQ